ncbi:ATP-binding protein [Fusobacterium varium]
MYTTSRHWFKYGNEDDELECTTLFHETLDKAITYAHRYAKGVRFASVTVEDEEGNILYEICDCGAKVIDYREEIKEQDLNTIEENQEVVEIDGYKYCLIVSQYHHDHIQFLVGLDKQFHQRARNLIMELDSYKAGKEYKELGDFKNKDDTKILPKYSYSGAGKILFLNCKTMDEVCKFFDEFREKEQTALTKYIRVGFKKAIQERHNYIKVRSIIEKYFYIL